MPDSEDNQRRIILKNAQTDNSTDAPCAEGINAVDGRVLSKRSDYERYAFTDHEANALNIFFDLAQEYYPENSLFNYVPVVILQRLFALESEFYVCDQDKSFRLVTPENAMLCQAREKSMTWAQIEEGPFESERCLYIPVRGRDLGNADKPASDKNLLGLLIIYAREKISGHERLFLEKFANRIGISMHNRLLAHKNNDHLEFVRNLVQDIGHNVLGPNMFFKLLIHQMDNCISRLGELLREAPATGEADAANKLSPELLRGVYQDLLNTNHEINLHFSHSSLFLESLLRESHFTKGEYVLRCQRVNLLERIVQPQYEHYYNKLAEKGIEASLVIEPAQGLSWLVDADVGLMSQVLANIFSNAFKYAAKTESGPAGMECRVMHLPGFLGKERGGVKVAVYTTGPAIAKNESGRLFEKYFRASNTQGISGTGKGLHFVQTIVENHKGAYGYDRLEGCNVFYFVLPVAGD